MTEVPTLMRACVVREHGDADTALKIEADFPAPTLSEGNVIVKNTFAGLNFIDTYHRKGLYPRELPFVAARKVEELLSLRRPKRKRQAGRLGRL